MMDSTFTDDEKRYVLAELLKVSKMDVGILVSFVKKNIEIDSQLFLTMQMPTGRTAMQCFQAAQHMLQTQMPVPIMPTASNTLKRKAGAEPIEPSNKRLAAYNVLEVPPAAPSPPPNPHPPHFQLPPIQPQPPQGPNGLQGNPQTPPLQTTVPPQKRRGRPPRSDRNKQLRPNLPQRLTPLAPQPSPPAVTAVTANSSPPFGYATMANAPALSAPTLPKPAPLRPIQIAPGPGPQDAPDPSPGTPTSYQTTSAKSGSQSLSPKKRARPASVERSQQAGYQVKAETEPMASSKT